MSETVCSPERARLLEKSIKRKEDRATPKLHAMPISSAGYKPAEEIGKTLEDRYQVRLAQIILFHQKLEPPAWRDVQ
jgi:hypothetical protein